jgi:GxxExxY protein
VGRRPASARGHPAAEKALALALTGAVVGRRVMPDHPKPMHHKVTKGTETHGGSGGKWTAIERRLPRQGLTRSPAKSSARPLKCTSGSGRGLLESIYRACLVEELRLRGIAHRQEVVLPINYRGLVLEGGYRLDLLVDDLVILELKSVRRLESIHEAQLLTYLRFSGRWLGLLLNFNTDRLRNGLKRMV